MDKRIIVLVVPDDVVTSYEAVINISDDYVTMIYDHTHQNWNQVYELIIEGLAYEDCYKIIEHVPSNIKISILENTEENYLHKVPLDRAGAIFMHTRDEILEPYRKKDNKDEKDGEKKSKRARVSPFVKKKEIKEPKEKKKIELLGLKTLLKKLPNKKAGNAVHNERTKASLEASVATKAVIKSGPTVKKSKKLEGLYFLGGSTMMAYLVIEALAKNQVLTVCDMTGKLNAYYRCQEDSKLTDLLSGLDDPYVIREKIYYYGDFSSSFTLEDLLKLKELLEKETQLILLVGKPEDMEGFSPAFKKIIFFVSEEEIIKQRNQVGEGNYGHKLLLAIHKRIGVLPRSEIRKQMAIEDHVEVVEMDYLRPKDYKQVLKAIFKEDSQKSSVVSQYIDEFIKIL